VWDDPTGYSQGTHGPPYLPGQKLSSDHKALVTRLVSKEANFVETLWQRYLDQMGSVYGGPHAPLSVLLAALRAAAMMHQTHHWQTRGGHSYGDHILFQRIYDDSLPFVDQIAERAVGAGTVHNVSHMAQMRHVATIGTECLYQGVQTADPGASQLAWLSLRAEAKLLVLITLVRRVLEQSNHLSDGTDNLLQGVADKHEEFTYLLKQRVSQG